MPSSGRYERPIPDPGRLRQFKLHEMALAYAGILHERARKLAAEMAGELRRQAPPAPMDGAWWERIFRLYLGDTLHAVIMEQCGDTASPFKTTVRGTFGEDLERAGFSVTGSCQTFAEFLNASGSDDEPTLTTAAERILAEKTGRLMALADLRVAEAVCGELLADIFHWDGRRFVISSQRAAEARAVVNRYLSAPAARPSEPPTGAATVKGAFKLALTVLYFWREPAPDILAGLKEGYASLGGPRRLQGPSADARGGGVRGEGRRQNQPAPDSRRELAEEIEYFCRTLDVLREAAAAAAS